MSEHQNILQIDTDAELQKIIRQLDSIPDQLKAPSVLASALNATANEMKRTMGKKARKRYAITDDRILKEKKRGGMFLERATGGHTGGRPVIQRDYGGRYGLYDAQEHENNGGHAESPERKPVDGAGG